MSRSRVKHKSSARPAPLAPRRRRRGTVTGKAWPSPHGLRLFAAVPRPILSLAVAGSVPRTDDHSRTSQAVFRTNAQPQPVTPAPSILPHETAPSCRPVPGLHLFSLICTASSSDSRPAISRSFVDPARPQFADHDPGSPGGHIRALAYRSALFVRKHDPVGTLQPPGWDANNPPGRTMHRREEYLLDSLINCVHCRKTSAPLV
ncbi:hypothetical protein B0T18DRAFT_177238 [Schizothecium vesticola]|uniref:Uncharacterized protein n=1 Tax=Schizothecium vesticola TaxID=314040 RepID=A0AA40EPP0_9PEZI|nr:hypothetical protein B0T18DRAFT_177238 [Schizothecium vesticola]